MTDFEKLVSSFNDKINYKINSPVTSKDARYLPTAIKTIIIQNSDAPDGVHLGCGGFYSEWFFDENDNLLGVGHWDYE